MIPQPIKITVHLETTLLRDEAQQCLDKTLTALARQGFRVMTETLGKLFFCGL